MGHAGSGCAGNESVDSGAPPDIAADVEVFVVSQYGRAERGAAVNGNDFDPDSLVGFEGSGRSERVARDIMDGDPGTHARGVREEGLGVFGDRGLPDESLPDAAGVRSAPERGLDVLVFADQGAAIGQIGVVVRGLINVVVVVVRPGQDLEPVKRLVAVGVGADGNDASLVAVHDEAGHGPLVRGRSEDAETGQSGGIDADVVDPVLGCQTVADVQVGVDRYLQGDVEHASHDLGRVVHALVRPVILAMDGGAVKIDFVRVDARGDGRDADIAVVDAFTDNEGSGVGRFFQGMKRRVFGQFLDRDAEGDFGFGRVDIRYLSDVLGLVIRGRAGQSQSQHQGQHGHQAKNPLPCLFHPLSPFLSVSCFWFIPCSFKGSLFPCFP